MIKYWSINSFQHDVTYYLSRTNDAILVWFGPRGDVSFLGIQLSMTISLRGVLGSLERDYDIRHDDALYRNALIICEDDSGCERLIAVGLVTSL